MNEHAIALPKIFYNILFEKLDLLKNFIFYKPLEGLVEICFRKSFYILSIVNSKHLFVNLPKSGFYIVYGNLICKNIFYDIIVKELVKEFYHHIICI